MNLSLHTYRHIYLMIAGFLVGILVAINFLPNPRLSATVALQQQQIEQQEQIIRSLITSTSSSPEHVEMTGGSPSEYVTKASALPITGLVLETDTFSIVVPSEWSNISEGIAIAAGSPDFTTFNSFDINCHNIAYAKTGSSVHISSYAEEVSLGIEEPTEYVEFVLSRNTSGQQESSLMSIDGHPFAYKRVDQGECGGYVALITRKNGQKIDVQYSFSGNYTDESELISEILNSIKFK